MTNQKSRLTIQNIKMLLPLRNRCVGLKFLEFRHRLAYKFSNNKYNFNAYIKSMYSNKN